MDKRILLMLTIIVSISMINASSYKDCKVFNNCGSIKSSTTITTSNGSSSSSNLTMDYTNILMTNTTYQNATIHDLTINGLISGIPTYINMSYNNILMVNRTDQNPNFNNLSVLSQTSIHDLNFSGNLYSNDSGFFFNETSHNLGIGNANPFYSLDIYQNLNADVQSRIRNAFAGMGSYMMAEANSNYVSLELKKTGSQDWKFGMFGTDSFIIYDGTASSNLFIVQNKTGNVNFTGDMLSHDGAFYFNTTNNVLKVFNLTVTGVTTGIPTYLNMSYTNVQMTNTTNQNLTIYNLTLSSGSKVQGQINFTGDLYAHDLGFYFNTTTNNVQIKNNLTIKQLSISNATNSGMDRCTLVAGVCTINNNRISNNTNVFCQVQQNAGTLGSMLYISNRYAGVNYTITDLGGTLDTSIVGCMLVEPNNL